MNDRVASIRGMNDILPEQSPLWRWMEERIRAVLEACGYSEIRLPVLERTELFSRSIGEATDIVEKEMYTFEDRNGDSLTLRPEGTAGCVRAAREHGLLHNATQRLWYAGPMFRHERPQAGRYRQFHQIGVETFGLEGPDIDAELVLMTARMWRALGVSDRVRLELNSLGSPEDRARYRDALVAYLREHETRLDEDSRRRLSTNPLRILDSKDEGTREVLRQAPRLDQYLGDDARRHFEALCALLDAAGVNWTFNAGLVRGLDYYGKTVFEWVTDDLGAQGTVCAGGRYDGLVEQLGGKPTPAVGFAMGLERLILLLEQDPPELPPVAELYIVSPDAMAPGMLLAEEVRDAMPGRRVVCHCGGGSFKSQMKKADRSGARLALLLGERELNEGRVTVKPLRGDGEQQSVARADLVATLRKLLEG